MFDELETVHVGREPVLHLSRPLQSTRHFGHVLVHRHSARLLDHLKTYIRDIIQRNLHRLSMKWDWILKYTFSNTIIRRKTKAV